MLVLDYSVWKGLESTFNYQDSSCTNLDLHGPVAPVKPWDLISFWQKCGEERPSLSTGIRGRTHSNNCPHTYQLSAGGGHVVLVLLWDAPRGKRTSKRKRTLSWPSRACAEVLWRLRSFRGELLKGPLPLAQSHFARRWKPNLCGETQCRSAQPSIRSEYHNKKMWMKFRFNFWGSRINYHPTICVWLLHFLLQFPFFK